ncbi:MAG: Gfo/Idh/MocA family oxidoreductase [Candidatus Promineifilaceae bacterium]
MESKVKVGIIGCGDISGAYIKGCRSFEILDIAGCADLIFERAVDKAAEFELPRAYRVDEMVADPNIEIIINLTTPDAHAEVSLFALDGGKHVYSEKPLATSRRDGRRILAAANDAGLLVGCAPDTFLGGGIQTCRKLIDDGWIGEVVGATAFMVSRGPESWHPNPGFFYQPGAGPLFDMTPYYLTALINLVGPVERVSSVTRASFSERIATSKERYGEKIKVEVPTHVAGLMNFVDGPVGSIIMSFDIWYAQLPRIEIYGAEGTISVPDPNNFGGVVRIRQAGDGDWSEIQHSHSVTVSRGIGVADMAYALRSGRQHRANGDMAFHVLDLMRAIEESSELGRHIVIDSRCDRPDPLPVGLAPCRLDR